ncbi:hypothetical protein D3C80_1426980 [compost metagenome]
MRLQLLEHLQALFVAVPEAQLAGGASAHGVGAQPGGLLEGPVGGEDAPAVAFEQQHDVGTVVERRAESLLGAAQGLLDLLALANVDAQPLEQSVVAAAQALDDGQHPDQAAVGGDQAVFVTGWYVAVTLQKGEGGRGIRRVQGAAAEVRFQPGSGGIAEQRYGLRRDAGEAQVAQAQFPADQRQLRHQAVVMLRGAAQAVLERGEALAAPLAQSPAPQQQAEGRQAQQEDEVVGRC